ncbi:MAG: hypothetical protein M9953_08955 [Thermomicrobiales bacterium]|nr:hypothetical protein [Thermomicrobiales bacterium]MCO5218838.1 hypothetical protein [Thermomicrobiales bacterium]MCO5225452.1 hypothetical protein [Thermomicrobiales bacterium]MCO5227926.1 hypothetical protein [Thermomicrobiales bacterium]
MSLRSSSSGDTARTGPAWLNIGIAIAMVATMFSALLGSASAQSTGSVAYLWANDPLAESYTPNEMYQYNSTGVANTITRTDVGVYVVNLPGMNSSRGNIQISATSGSNEAAPFGVDHHCLVTNLQGSDVTVKCLATGGTPVDTGFLLLFTMGDVFLGWNSAFVFAYQKDVESYVVEGSYQYNQHGLQNSVTRNGVGDYMVTLGGMGTEEGTIQVTTVSNLGLGENCKPGYWGIDEAGAKYIAVYCTNAAGEMIDSEFMLWHGAAVTANSADGAWEVWPRGAYLMVNHYHDEGQYTPGRDWQFSTNGTPAEAVWTSTGVYDVILPDVFNEDGFFQVTAFSDANKSGVASCQTVRWDFEGDSGVRVTVLCFDETGAPVDAPFFFSYTTPEE